MGGLGVGELRSSVLYKSPIFIPLREDSCDDHDESYSIRAGWWLVGLCLGSGWGLVLRLGSGWGKLGSWDVGLGGEGAGGVRACVVGGTGGGWSGQLIRYLTGQAN